MNNAPNKKRKWTLRKKIKTVWAGSGLVFLLWLFYNMQAQDVDKSLLKSDDLISFENADDYYAFTPSTNFKEVLVFYPGALVQPKAYVPLCRAVAEHGIKVYLMKMPWRQAIIGYEKPKELNILSDTSLSYTLAGHSQGAKMAAQFVYENPGIIDRLILLGTTHPRDISLADGEIPILKVYGTKDGVADERTMWENKSKLPTDTQFLRIEGGNHSQFGHYGFQLGDNSADIDREHQQQAVFEGVLAFMKESQ